MKQVFTIAILFVTIFSVQSTVAQKIGHINSLVILSNHPDIQAADKELGDLQNAFATTIQTKVQNLQNQYAELQTKENEIAPKDLQAQVQKLQEKEVALQEEDKELQNELMKKREELYQPILDVVNAAIEEVAIEGGYSYIMDMNQGTVLYADENSDVTELVMAKLGIEKSE